MGLLAGIASFFGSGAGAAVLGGAGVDLAKNQLSKAFDTRRAKRLGLTPQEFIGSVGSGGPGDGAMQVLGNQAAAKEAQQRQQAFDMQERSKDRDVELIKSATNLEAARLSANATIQASAQSAAAQRYSANASIFNVTAQLQQRQAIDANQAELIQNQANAVKQQMQNDQIAFDERYIMKMLGMSSDNYVGLVVSRLNGVKMDDLLADYDLTAEQAGRLQASINSITAQKSTTKANFAGLVDIITGSVRQALGGAAVLIGPNENTLGANGPNRMGN